MLKLKCVNYKAEIAKSRHLTVTIQIYSWQRCKVKLTTTVM